MFPPPESLLDKYLGGFVSPRFVTLEEDVTLMSSWWRDKYGAKRVILWDDTNINIPAASDAHLNRHTYAACYAGNVVEGAMFLHLCGWMGTWELWAGCATNANGKNCGLSFLSDILK